MTKTRLKYPLISIEVIGLNVRDNALLYITHLKKYCRQKKKLKRNKFKTKSFVKSLEKKMLDIERYMETFQESISKRFEKQENNFMNLTDKMKSFEVTQREYKKRLSSLEDHRNADENEDIELQKVKNFNYLLFFSFFYLHQF